MRQMTGVEMQPLPQEKGKPPTTDLVKQLVGFTTMMSYLSASWLPATDAYQPFFITVGLVGATVSSLLIGNVNEVKAKMNPIVTCAVLSNLGVYIMGLCTGAGYQATLKLYKSGVSFTDMNSLSAMGAGDILMAFLGSVIVSFAFKVYGARKIIKRHAVEIFTCLVGTSTFAMFSTALLGRLIGLTPAISLIGTTLRYGRFSDASDRVLGPSRNGFVNRRRRRLNRSSRFCVSHESVGPVRREATQSPEVWRQLLRLTV